MTGLYKKSIDNVVAHHIHSIDDQRQEIKCIEQNLTSFCNFTDFQKEYKEFCKDFNFNIGQLTLSQFNQQYHIIRTPLNHSYSEQLGYKRQKKDHIEVVKESDIKSIDYNWEVDFILKNAQQYNKEPKNKREGKAGLKDSD